MSTFGSNATESLISQSINAFSHLEGLTLNLDDYVSVTGISVECKSLPGLQALLGSMPGLRRLKLGLFCEKPYFNHRQVFPTDSTQWVRLIQIDLWGLAISIKDLVHLLTARMPNLLELTLLDLDLLEGRWEGVIEFLKTSMHLLSFAFDGSCQLRHQEGVYFLDDGEDDDEGSDLKQSIETYVVSGGRHPCLRPDEDASASRRYLLDLDL